MFEGTKNVQAAGAIDLVSFGLGNIPLYEMTSDLRCKYSDSCFTCPLPDCRAPNPTAHRVNRLPADDELATARRGHAMRESHARRRMG